MRILLAVAAIALPLSIAAHDSHATDPEDVIEARRAYFELFGANIGPLAAMAKGEVEYNAEAAQLYARNFAMLSGYNPTPHFAPGTSNEDVPGKTRALPAIWEDQAGFGEKIAAFSEAVEALQPAAGAGRAELGAAVQQLGGTCKECHDDYRAKDF